jgi:hypothetical protein
MVSEELAMYLNVQIKARLVFIHCRKEGGFQILEHAKS